MMARGIDCGAGVSLERGAVCTLSDGTRLVSDHYYPPQEISGPWPTMLMRQPYGRDIASTVVYAHPAWFAARGFHVVIQDVRGRGDSEGDFYPFRHEGKDGAETIAWLMRHTACNGRIGMYGFSYQGMTQFLAAAENPAGLVCIAPHMAAADLYHGWFYHHGAFRLASGLGWGIQMMREDARRRGLRAASEQLEAAWSNVRMQPQHAPYACLPALDDSRLPQYVRDWMEHREYGEYWSSLDISARYERITVPAFHIAGWYDTYLEGTITGYAALRERAGSTFAREHQYLLAGPWVHIPWGDRAGDATLGEAANLDTDEMLLRWMNHWLKGSEEFAGEPRVKHFALGANQWRTAEEWPETADFALHLHSDGKANSRKGDGRLSSDKPNSAEPRDLFVYDPEVPVVAPGGAHGLSGAADQSAMELGNHLLVYRTPEATQRIAILGRPRVVLYAQTSADCADLTAKLVRVTTTGRAEFVCIGVARSSYLFRDSEYLADTVHRWEFSLEPTSLEIAPGERLALEIAGSAFPLYDRNPSRLTPPQHAGPWNWTRSTHQILHTPEHASTLYLPCDGDTSW